MKKFFIAVVICMVLMNFIATGCSEKKTENPVDSLTTDTLLKDTVAADTLDSIIASTPMPKAADALFDDFLFNFAANSKLQKERIIFPLKCKNGEKVTMKQKDQWRMDYFFMHQGYYTLMFDTEKQLDIVKDTAVKVATVEKIYFRKQQIEQYKFQRIRGAWMLTEIETIPLQSSSNASFLSFYDRFSRDESFQIKSLHNPVKMTVPDPDDDFRMMTGDIYPEQWVDYRPQVMPKDFIYNIRYGQNLKSNKNKMFIIRGIANGLETQLTFQRTGGAWKLMKFVN